MWEVFKSGIVLLGLLLYFVPLLFAIRYQKTKSECSPALVSESEVRFTMLDDCWFFHLKGIVISIVLALIIGILVIVIRKIDATMSGSRV